MRTSEEMGSDTPGMEHGGDPSIQAAGSRAGGLGMREPMTHIRDDLATLGTDVAEAGRRVVQTGAQAITDTAQRVSGKARDMQRAICDYATERPMTSLLVTLGAGIVIGALFLRRR